MRALATDLDGRVVDVAQRDLTQSYPAPGLGRARRLPRSCGSSTRRSPSSRARLHAAGDDVGAIGITNQRETTVAIDRADGRVLAPAIVWQDRRTADACADARDATVTTRRSARAPGSPPTPTSRRPRCAGCSTTARSTTPTRLGLCTIDTLVCWHLTGGPDGGAYAHRPVERVAHLLYDLDAGAWSDELCALFGVPRGALAEILPSCGPFGEVAEDLVHGPRGVPVAGILGDQQAALFGQRCTSPGMVKATFGTGAFLLANAGDERPARRRRPRHHRRVGPRRRTVARAFALEGAAFVAGAAIQWLARRARARSRPRRRPAGSPRRVDDANGACFVPALARARQPLVGPRGARHAHGTLARRHARARRACGRRRAGLPGARDARRDARRRRRRSPSSASTVARSSMDLLCQSLADGARLVVRRPTSVEATAVGAATIAGVARRRAHARGARRVVGARTRRSRPSDAPTLDAAYERWLDAVGRARALRLRRLALDVGVDVRAPRQLGDLGHQLVGERAERLALAQAVRPSSCGHRPRLAVGNGHAPEQPRAGAARSAGRRSCPRMPIGTTGPQSSDEPRDAGAAAVRAAVVGARALGVHRDEPSRVEHLARGLERALGHRAAAAADRDLADRREEQPCAPCRSTPPSRGT